MNSTRSARRSGQKGVETTESHSVRTPKETWRRALARAARESSGDPARPGLPINRVIIELLEGYSRGIYRLPKRSTETVRTYDAPIVPKTAETGELVSQ